MPTSRSIHFDVIPLINRHWEGDVQKLAKLLADHLIGEFDTGAFIGQSGGPEPSTDVGSWLTGNVWFARNAQAGRYIPFPLVSGNLVGNPQSVRYTILVPTAQAQTVLYLPDQNGATLATLDDLQNMNVPNETETHSGATVTLDFSKNTRFYINLTGNVTINRTGAIKDGQQIDIYFQTPPSSGPYTITWNPSDFYGISSGSLSSADSSHMSVTRVRANVVGPSVYVEFEETFTVAVTKDVTGPQMVSVEAEENENEITVTFNELLTAATLSASAWVVTKNGSNNLVTAATASGSKVVLTLASGYQQSDAGTVAYIGSDAKDVAGNAAPVFGASTITINPVAPSGTPDPATVNLITGL